MDKNTITRGLIVLGAVAVAGCDDRSTDPRGQTVTHYGDEVAIGNGTARAYITLAGGEPVELGIALSEDALDGLPTEGGLNQHIEYILPPPNRLDATPYRLIELDWNAHGHEPEGVYSVPHFDFHFYTISDAERLAISPEDPAFETKAANHPPAEYLPEGFIAIPGAVPFMGVHWVDPTGPELNGEPFTHTFIYGTWDGRLIFAEPMAAVEFLATKPDVEVGITVPSRFDPAGSYPDHYRIYWDADAAEYRLALTGFAPRS